VTDACGRVIWDGPPRFSARLENEAGVPRLVLSGELDIATDWHAELALRAAERRDPRILLVDLRRLEFIGCSGVRLLFEASRRAADHGRRFLCLVGPGLVLRTIRLLDRPRSLELVQERGGRDPGSLATLIAAHSNGYET
jgi:anti-anti-sigma factor